MSKELWFHFYERRLAEGYSEDDAAQMAFTDEREHYADMVDEAKMRAKESGNWPPREKA